METATAEAPMQSLRAAFDGAHRGGVPEPEPGPGWVVLRHCALGGGGPRVSLALLHPDVGVALVDSAPEATDAAERFRRSLDARRFRAIFGGYPPVARVILPIDGPPDLGRVVAAAFEALPPLTLAGGDAWVRTARAALEAEAPVAVPEPLRAKRRRGFPRSLAVLVGATAGTGVALATLLVLPGHGPRNAAEPAGLDGGAPGLAVRPATARDNGQTAATPPSSAALASEPEDATGGGEDITAVDVFDALLSAELAADDGDAGVGADAQVAAVPRTSGGPPTDTAAAGGEPPPAPSVTASDGFDRSPPHAPPPAAAVLPNTAGAATETPPSRRAAAPPPADPPRIAASQAPAAVSRRTASPASPAPPPESGGGGRCRDILRRATMGETLPETDWGHLRRGCQPRG